MKRLGFTAYAAILGLLDAQPRTRLALAPLIGLRAEGARELLSAMERLELIWPVSWESCFRGAGWVPVYGINGAAAPHPGRRVYPPSTTLRPDLATFARLVLALKREPMSLADLADESGMSRSKVGEVLRHLHTNLRLIHVAAWRRLQMIGGNPVACYRWGHRRDSQRPRAEDSHVSWRRAKQVLHSREDFARQLFLTAGRPYPRPERRPRPNHHERTQ